MFELSLNLIKLGSARLECSPIWYPKSSSSFDVQCRVKIKRVSKRPISPHISILISLNFLRTFYNMAIISLRLMIPIAAFFLLSGFMVKTHFQGEVTRISEQYTSKNEGDFVTLRPFTGRKFYVNENPGSGVVVFRQLRGGGPLGPPAPAAHVGQSMPNSNPGESMPNKNPTSTDPQGVSYKTLRRDQPVVQSKNGGSYASKNNSNPYERPCYMRQGCRR